jgi:hypothetical protein
MRQALGKIFESEILGNKCKTIHSITDATSIYRKLKHINWPRPGPYLDTYTDNINMLIILQEKR